MVTVWDSGKSWDYKPTQIQWVTDRSRMTISCDWKRWGKYHSGPANIGVDSIYKNEELVLGSAVHKGLELLLLEHPEDAACQAAYDEVSKAQIAFGEAQLLELLGPDALAKIRLEQAILAQILVKTFARRHLDNFKSQYEIVSIEDEINWPLYTEDLESQVAIVASRPDVILKDRITDALIGVSYKTAASYDVEQLNKFRSDLQRITEGWAITHRYGRDCEGIQYIYFLKGEKQRDSNLGGARRYSSTLIRPWLRKNLVGAPQPSDFRMVGSWTGDDGKTHKLGSAFERVDIWEVMDVNEWFEWLDLGLVDTERERDWLAEAIAIPMIQPWNRPQAERWLASAVNREIRFMTQIAMVNIGKTVDEEFYRDSSCCYDFNKPCQFYDICWGADSLQARLINGKLQVREPNHPIEILILGKDTNGNSNETANTGRTSSDLDSNTNSN